MTAAEQRRRCSRHTVRGEAKLEALNESHQLTEPVGVMLQDVGRNGVRFDTDRPLEAGSTWRLRIILRGHLAGSLPIIVRHSRPAGGGVYHIGAQVMIEPIILSHLGVTEHELMLDDLDEEEVGPGTFTTPDALGGEADLGT